jgi:hypothetical protein
MIARSLAFALLGWTVSPNTIFACGVNTTAPAKISNRKAGDGSHLAKSLSLMNTDSTKDNRWEKVKLRLKKAREVKAAAKP